MRHGAWGMGRQGRQGEKSPAPAWGIYRRGCRRHQNFRETRRINPDFTVTIPNAQCPMPNTSLREARQRLRSVQVPNAPFFIDYSAFSVLLVVLELCAEIHTILFQDRCLQQFRHLLVPKQC